MWFPNYVGRHEPSPGHGGYDGKRIENIPKAIDTNAAQALHPNKSIGPYSLYSAGWMGPDP